MVGVSTLAQLTANLARYTPHRTLCRHYYSLLGSMEWNSIQGKRGHWTSEDTLMPHMSWSVVAVIIPDFVRWLLD